MADKNISTLPAVESIDNDSLFVAEQQGVASKVTGAQVASFAEEAANANVQAAVVAAKRAQEAAETAEAAAQVTAHPPQVNEETGFWQVWNSGTGAYEDTTIQAEGPVGPQGTSVKSITRTSGTGAAGTTDTYTMYDSDDEAIGTFTVYNGADGIGSGDMLKSVYDTKNKNTDIFTYADGILDSAKSYTDTSIQAAILDSWEASY